MICIRFTITRAPVYITLYYKRDDIIAINPNTYIYIIYFIL